MLLLVALSLCACEPAYSLPNGDTDQDAETSYNVRVSPQYAYQGTTFKGGKLSFSDNYLPTLKAKLEKGDPARQSWDISFGPGINFELARFESSDLSFNDLQGVVSAVARTGERQVRVRITYGDVTVVEWGRFYVLPPQQDSTGGVKAP